MEICRPISVSSCETSSARSADNYRTITVRLTGMNPAELVVDRPRRSLVCAAARVQRNASTAYRTGAHS
ncbi:Uncharacterised protein [Mycobacteroides abscessus subsp. abscessus]|nr:Uncharacterised protein [Mycobacteroides abscessus subsp. abscessus]